MKSRDEEILEQLIKLCEVNELVRFDISLPLLKEDGKGFLCFENTKYDLEQLQLSSHDITQLERIDKISLVRKHRLNELSQSEFFRTTYSIQTSIKVVTYPLNNFTRPINYIALIGGFIVTTFGVIMKISDVDITGIETLYTSGLGYGGETMTSEGMLLIGAFLLGIALVGFYLRARSKK